MMTKCINTARSVGVFQEFHVLTDKVIEDCHCYDAMQIEYKQMFFKLHYLKVGMAKLKFDYFIWIDADSIFCKNHLQFLKGLGGGPIHVPLECDLSLLPNDSQVHGVPCGDLVELARKEGVSGAYFAGQSAFWIVHHDVIDLVYDLVLGFAHKGRAMGLHIDANAGLSFAMHLLCATPESHRLIALPDYWASDNEGLYSDFLPQEYKWVWRDLGSGKVYDVSPAVVHLPHSKALLTGKC